MSFRIPIIGVMVLAGAAASAAAQQAEPSLAALARKVEAERSQPKKPARTYTNADLATMPVLPPPPPPEGFVSKTTGQEVSKEEMLKRSEAAVAEVEARKAPESSWRSRAKSIRTQVENLTPRLATLQSRPPNPNAGLQKKAEDEMAMIRQMLADQKKKWAALEEDLRVSKAELTWILPVPSFP